MSGADDGQHGRGDRRGASPPAWERQRGESAEAHAAFLAYRDLDVGRSLEGLNRDRTDGVPKISTLKAWSTRYKWVERSRAWDNHLRAERDKVRAKYAAMNERRRIKALEVNFNISQRLRAKAMKMLDFPLKIEKIDKDGKTIHVHPAKWQMSTISEMLRLAAEIEHAVLEATVPPVDKCTIEELKAMLDASDRSLREVVEADERPADS